MPPPRSKTRQKKVGKEKVNGERNMSSSGDSKSRCGRRREGKSGGQLKGKESLPGQGDTLEEEPVKIQRQGRIQGSKESGHKKLFQGKRAYKRNDKSECGLGRKHREQAVSRLEGEKGKACKQQGVTPGQESGDSRDKEGKSTTKSKKNRFKKKCGKRVGVREKVTELESIKDVAEQSAEGSFQKHNSPEKGQKNLREKPRGKQSSKEASGQKSRPQSQGSTAQGKGERAGKKKVEKHTRIVITKSEENFLETSDESCSDSSSEGHRTHGTGTKETGVDSTSSSEEESSSPEKSSSEERSSSEEKSSSEERGSSEEKSSSEDKSSSEEKSSSSEEDGNSEAEAVLDGPSVAEGKGYKELVDEKNEASIEPEREQVTADGKIESEGEGTEFAELEAEEKVKNQDDMLTQPKGVLAESTGADDEVNISEFQVKSLKNREKNKVDKENILENDRVRDRSEDEHTNSDSIGESRTEGSIDEGKENTTKLLPAVKAKLHIPLSKVLQGSEQEEKGNDEGSTLENSPLLSKQQRTLKEKSGRCEAAEQCEEVGHRQRDSSSDHSKQELAVVMPTKSSQSQIPLSPKNKHKTAETKLLPSCKPNPAQMALDTNSDLKKAENTCSKPRTPDTLSKHKEPNSAHSSGEERSNTSSCSSTTKTSPDKQLLGKKKVGKVTGKVKLSSGETSEAKKGKAEEAVAEAPSETEHVCDWKGSKHLQTHSTVRKVTSWLGPKPAKKARLKTRLLSVARAIGISRWLLKKFGKKKKSSKPLGFRSRMAIRILSTAGWMGRSGKAFPGAAGQLGRAELRDKESSPLVEEKGGPRMAEEVGHMDLPSSDSPLHGSSSFPHLDEEKNNSTDAKFAIVFPRVHSLVKAKNSWSRGSGKGCSLEKLSSLSDRKSVTSVQQDCRFRCDLPRSLLGQSQRNSKQGFLLHGGEDPVRTSDFSREVDAKEGSGVPQTAGFMGTACVHWSQQQAQGGDPAEWLNSELLLPRLTIENLSKWAIYKDPQLASTRKVCKERWEAEDVTDNRLEMEFMQKQVCTCEDFCAEAEEIEDLTRLEEVCESSVLLCLKKRFHRNLIYTYIGQILVSVNPFKDLRIYSEDVATQYHQGTFSKNAPHIFAIAEMAYTLSQSSGQEQCVVISGHSGSGKTEAAKAIVQYLTMLYQRSDSHRIRQPCNVLPILESFGNARTILNDNSSRFGKLLNVHLQHGAVVGTSISQYLLEKSRVVFQAHGERNYHVFYELLAGLPLEQREEMYLQEAESYFYLNQGRACDILGKDDSQDFLVLVQALEGISLSEDQLSTTWAVLAAILQLGNICFTSCEKESYEHAAIASGTEIQIVASLLCVSADFLQSAVTHRVTVTSYDRIFTPLSVEGAIDARDSIAKTLYYLLFEWLLLRINEWLAPWESDCAMGIVDIHGFEDLGVNSLEQLCINFANEHLQQFFSQTVVAQEEEEYSQEQLSWIPISKMYSESCLDFFTAKPHGILCILDDQTSLTQATDHTFLQKCHYHHGNSPWYTKPKLPLPVFTVKHYAGPVTYQVHKFLNKNRDQLRPEVLDIFSQSRLKVVSHIFQKAKAAYSQQRKLGPRGKGLKPQPSTLVSKFQQSLQDLTAKLRRSHAFFIRCITPNPKKLSNIFDVEYVTCQLRHSGILEAIHIRKEGYPIRLPFQSFLARYGLLAGQRLSCLEGREGCAAVLARVVGNPSDLYQIGVTKVFLKEKARHLLERRWMQRQSWAVVTLQRKFRCLLHRRRLRVLQEKVTVIQAHFRGYQARKRYRRLKKTLVQFHTMILISRPLIQRRKRCQQELEERKRRQRSLASGDTEDSPNQGMDVGLLEIPAELAALLHFVEGRHGAQANQITETLPPEVKVKDDLSLPPTINSYPFSSFIKSHFQKADFPGPGQPLHQPLTHLGAEHQESALEINKLVRDIVLDLVEEQILRFIGDKSLRGWQEVLLGNYIAGRGLSQPALRNEIFSQVVAQTWKNPDMEHSQRAWVLMAALLSCFAPSPALEKPLLKFVSDHGMEGYNAVCQHKILTAAPYTETDCASSRAFPPTQLEWTANQRRGKMVLDVHTFNVLLQPWLWVLTVFSVPEEKFSAEVESWMTGEQFAGWILSARGCDKNTRGWSVSMLTGNTWQDLLGCDFVLDLLGEMEETSNFSSSSQSSAEFPITSERDRSIFQSSDLDFIPPAPSIRAPAFPPPSLPPEFMDLHPDPRIRDDLRTPVGLDHYVDDLFSPVLHQGSRASDLENRDILTGRMKGGGKIGPTGRGILPSTGFPGMAQTPVYQPMPSMMGMPTAMPMMPGAGGIAAMPAMVMPQPMLPAVDPNQLAAQQQAFINQQAMLMAQQMTLQAMSISQQQQQQLQKSLEKPRPRVSSPPRAQAPATLPKPNKPSSSQDAAPPPKSPEPSPKAKEPVYDYAEDKSSGSEADDSPPETFQQKREYFQKMGEQHIQVKKVRPPTKTWTPPANPQPEQEEEKKQEEKRKEVKPVPKAEAAPASPLPSAEPKPSKQTPKVKKEPPVVKSSVPESRPAPSHEIGNIIKMYQSRPAPEPQPIEPKRRVSTPFIRKNDPKNEALAKLGMMNSSPCPPPSPVPQEKKTPPPVKPKPSSASSSIKEKQLPLLSIFRPDSTSPAAPDPPAPSLPPPVPSPVLPEDQGRQESTQKDSAVTIAGDGGIKTKLYKLTSSISFSYMDPAWKIFLRKEVFYPKENFSHPYSLNLLCEQIIRDTFSDSCFRISREEKRKMKDLLMEFRVGNDVHSIKEDGIKKRIVLAARDNWANYFSRLFPVHGEEGSDVQLLGVSHRAIRLLKVEKAAGYNPEHLKILRSYCFADVLSVELKGSNALEFSLKTEQLFLHSPKAPGIKAMVDLFIQELRQDTNYVVALRSYIVDDKSLLSFKRGDLIELLPMQGVEPGWQFGSTGGRCGLFPTNLVQLAAAPDYLSTSMDRRGELGKSRKSSPESRNTSKESSVPSLTSEPDSTMLIPVGDHYTMTDFATAYFREAQSRQGLKGMAAEKKSVADLVRHTKVPIQESLLRYSESELNDLATKNFQTLMRLMGDLSKHKNQSEAECIYEILQLCKEKEHLHDEVYCQVIKQVTHNPNQESVMRGWLVLNLLTGYFLPSKVLMPYATKFLQLASSDPSSTHHDIAKICQSNLRKNFMYGGRRHLPFPVEMEALLKGHVARRLLILMPGGMEYLTRIRTFTVAKEVLQEICEEMGVGKMVRPIKPEEYLHDYLLEDKMVTVTLRRLTWRAPLHFENPVYTNIHYGQVLWDYLNGRMLLSQSKEMEMQVGLLAMLQHWAKPEQQNSAPSREELQQYTPKILQRSISSMALQNQVATLLRTRQPLQPLEAKIQFIEHVMQLPFFGYTTFIVERVSDKTIPVPCFLGVNKEEIIVVESISQTVSRVIPLREMQKMRTLRPVSNGLPGLELNYGSPASPKTMWVELPQAKELYHTIVAILDKAEHP
ncbi:myosin XVB isoform X3 [Willisornis vidua]|uniref:Myosin XVB isoform X3 n=1 Tax=Willisornis vidua TaxID=1566151 RepID=A0ABQ9DX19_9PASS|nr:myosin XVB isoform X3 [Willisornis vidua]